MGRNPGRQTTHEDHARGASMIELLSMVFLTSIVGSLHCLSMCGPLSLFYGDPSSRSSELKGHLIYNGGRMLSYVFAGTLAGTLGAALELGHVLPGIEKLAALITGSLIIAWGGVQLFEAIGLKERATIPTTSTWFRHIARALPALNRSPRYIRALGLGISSTLLPCGWLFGFLATAAGTGHPQTGGVVMLVFWLGTLPAMLSAGHLLRSAAKILSPRLGFVMPILFIFLGFTTLYHRTQIHIHDKVCHSEVSRP